MDFTELPIARVCTEDNRTLGTAFVVLSHPCVALTCHHVVGTTGDFKLDFGHGRILACTVSPADCFQQIDLAIIRSLSDSPLAPLPIETDYSQMREYHTAGFHFYGPNLSESFPAQGKISGETSVKYEFDGINYDLQHVLVLKDETIDGGISGAPAIDPESRVALAIVNARFRASPQIAGFAIPLLYAQRHSPVIADIFAKNRLTVPRYGRFLNCLAAIDVCAKQRSTVVGRIIRRNQFLPDKYCSRRFEEVITGFLDSDSHLILPVVGNAGVGKTMLLSQLAHRSIPEECIFLLARDLVETDINLPLSISSQIRDCIPEHIGPKFDFSLMTKAIRESGRQLVVLLDGLNEITRTLNHSLAHWIEASVDWLESTRTKLIVSSRPEFWEIWRDAFPASMVFSYSAPDKSEDLPVIQKEVAPFGVLPETHEYLWIPEPLAEFDNEGSVTYRLERREIQNPQILHDAMLGDFDDDEVVKAKEKYQLHNSVSIGHIRHPLLARIYWELKLGKNEKAPTTRYSVVKRFVEIKCDRIARELGPNTVRSYVEASLKNFARRTLELRNLEIDQQEFFTIIKDRSVGGQFILEGILTNTGNGVRFVFDEIGEFVQSQLLDNEMIQKWLSEPTGIDKAYSTGVLVYAICRLDFQKKSQQVQNILRAIIGVIEDEKRYNSHYFCECVLVSVFSQLGTIEYLHREIELAAVAQISSNQPFVEWIGFRAVVASIDIPISLKLKILKMYLVLERSEDFKVQLWQKVSTNVFKNNRHTASILGFITKFNPKEAFEILITWLHDETSLRNGEASVSHVAGALMFHFRHLAFEFLCDSLGSSSAPMADTVLRQITDSDPERMIGIFDRWSTLSNPMVLSKAAYFARDLGERISSPNQVDQMFVSLSRIIDKGDKDAALNAEIAIGKLEKYRNLVVEKLLRCFKEGHPLVGEYVLLDWYQTHFDHIIRAIEEMIESPHLSERCSSAVYILIRPVHRGKELPLPKDFHLWEQVLKKAINKGLLVEPYLRYSIEAYLEKVDSKAKFHNAVILVKELFGANEAVHENLIYFALTDYPDNKYRSRLRRYVLYYLLDRETGLDMRLTYMRLLADKALSSPNLFSLFERAGKGMTQDEFHRSLVYAAGGELSFAPILLEWLDSRRITPSGATRRFVENVDSGLDLSNALRKAVE